MFVTNSTGPFRYLTSLSDQAEPRIRLLELHKQSLFSTEIKISLEEYQFDDTLPAYDTLSYAWGHDQRSKTILCNGKSFSVGVVLWQALSQLSRWPSYERRLLWIDRICSNQDDAKEKSQQVALMRDIFARSRKTIAWLGSLIPREDLQTAQAIRELLQLTKISLTLILTLCKDQAPKANWYRWIWLPNSLAISVLLKRSWFRRVWVVQEVAVSKKVIVQCRNDTIDFDVLVLGIMLFGKISSHRAGPDVGSGVNLVRHSELNLMTHLRHRESGSISYELSDLLAATHRAGATDIRDKLYGLYGITSTSLDGLSLNPNYDLPKRKVLVETIYSVMKDARNLDLLELAEGYHSGDPELPSWILAAHGPGVYGQRLLGHSEAFQVSSLDATAKHVYDKHVYDDNAKKFKDVSTAQLQRAFQVIKDLSIGEGLSGRRGSLLPHSEMTYLELDATGALHLHGQLVDSIQQVQPTKIGSSFVDQDGTNVPFSLTSPKEFQTLAHVLIDIDDMIMARAKSCTYPNGEGVLVAYRKTMCAGQQVLRRQEIMTEEEADAAFDRTRTALSGARATTWLERKAGVDVTFGVGTAASFMAGIGFTNSIEVRSIWYLIADNVFTRAVAWTQKGYLALVPEETEAGDSVALLKGGRMPFVLRPGQVGFRLLGPAYIHGIMDGELSDDAAVGIIKLV